MANDFVSNYRGAKSRLAAQNAVKKSLPTRGDMQKANRVTNNQTQPNFVKIIDRTPYDPKLLEAIKYAESLKEIDPASLNRYNQAAYSEPVKVVNPAEPVNKAVEKDSWDWDKINKILENRSAYASEENPGLSLDVEIPVTTNTRKIQYGKLKLLNDVNNTGLSKDMALYIVGNTYQDYSDGVHYGMGWDGRPYSYKIEGDEVKDFKPLGPEEQKRAIGRLTDGKVTVDDSIDNPGTLAQIYRSIKRMQDYSDGHFTPNKARITDENPGVGNISGVLAWARPNGYKKEGGGQSDWVDLVNLINADFPDINASASLRKGRFGDGEVKWWSTSHPDDTTSHELAHTADFNDIDRRVSDWVNRKSEEANKYIGKYTIGQLYMNFANNLADNLLSGRLQQKALKGMDRFYGGKTHFFDNLAKEVSDEEKENAYGYNFFVENPEPPRDLSDEMYSELNRKYKIIYEKLSDGDIRKKILKKAAENTGFDSWVEAASTVSSYGTHNDYEAVAEAYNDVLFNKDKARPFSKELIKLFIESAKEWDDRLSDKPASDFQKNLKNSQRVMAKQELNDPVVYYERIKKNNNPFSK